jgi:hypothetical protein
MTTVATAAVLRTANGDFELEEVQLGPLASNELLVPSAGVPDNLGRGQPCATNAPLRLLEEGSASR